MRTIIFFYLACCFSLFAQETQTDTIIEALKLKIEKSESEERLHWMDSLSNVIAYETDH